MYNPSKPPRALNNEGSPITPLDRLAGTNQAPEIDDALEQRLEHLFRLATPRFEDLDVCEPEYLKAWEEAEAAKNVLKELIGNHGSDAVPGLLRHLVEEPRWDARAVAAELLGCVSEAPAPSVVSALVTRLLDPDEADMAKLQCSVTLRLFGSHVLQQLCDQDMNNTYIRVTIEAIQKDQQGAQ